MAHAQAQPQVPAMNARASNRRLAHAAGHAAAQLHGVARDIEAASLILSDARRVLRGHFAREAGSADDVAARQPAIVALQSEDIAIQLLAHARQQVSDVGEVLRSLVALAGLVDEEAVSARVEQATRALDGLARRRRPVGGVRGSEGSVEIF